MSCGGGLQDELKLEMFVEPVRVVSIAAVGGTTGRLHEDRPPGFRTQDAQKRLGVHRPGPHFDIIRLLD